MLTSWKVVFDVLASRNNRFAAGRRPEAPDRVLASMLDGLSSKELDDLAAVLWEELISDNRERGRNTPKRRA